MVRRRPPGTEEGWYALHDLRRIDWDAWREAHDDERARALGEGIDYLRRHVSLADADEGGSAAFSIVGHKADVMILHLRPTLGHLERAERRFEATALAEFTERADSYVSVTEVSGYMHEDLTDGLESIEDAGMRNYMRQRIYPEIPDAECVCFYPMDKRRGPEDNWYDLPFDERAEYMSAHGDVGRQYAGRVTQIITGSVGLDDHEWGVTLFADDLTDVKHLLYEMRFDPSSSRFAEFGTFYVGRQFAPDDLASVFDPEVDAEADATADDISDPSGAAPEQAGDVAGATEDATAGVTEGSPTGRGGGGPPTGDPAHEEIDVEDFHRRVRRFGVDFADHPEAGYALLVMSSADAEALVEPVDGLRSNFDHYDTHVLTTVRANAGDTAIVSLWANERAATTAAGFLADLPGAEPGVGAALADATDEGSGADEGQEADDGASTEADSSGAAEALGTDADDDIRAELEELNVYAGQPHGEDVYALVLYSEADPETLDAELSSLADRFDHYDTHVSSAVYADVDGGDRSAIVSIWETQQAANTAGGFLADLPDVVERAGEESGFGTMGMFYTVKPAHREEFLETFAEVGGLLDDMEGHVDSRLLADVDDENDMFIASQWRTKADAMEFFRSEAFRETVQWGREILDGRPRHVFLA